MRTRAAVIGALAGLAALAVVGALGTAPAAHAGNPAAAGGREGVPAFGHVFLVVGENTTYDKVDPASAPYLASTLRSQGAWLTDYYAATHWSQANYMALVTGGFTDCDQHGKGVVCHRDVDNLFQRLDGAGLSWKVWLESGTAKCDTGSGGTCTSTEPCPLTGFYTTGNPPVLLDGIEGPGGVWSATTPSAECLANDVPAGTATDGMARFDAALASGDVPRFNMVLPNGCEDGEANCKPLNDKIRQFDAFLAREVPKILASPAFGDDGVLVVTYDEDMRPGGLAPKNGLASGGHVVCVIVSPMLRPGTYGGAAGHYSLLRTIQDGFGLDGYLGHAADVAPIAGVWQQK